MEERTERETQKRAILHYLREHEGITQADATEEIGCQRLPARICDLRGDGHKIINVWRKSRNRYGRRVRFVEYRLVE